MPINTLLRSRKLLLIGLLFSLAILTSSCQRSDISFVTQVEFNPKLRRDLRALTDAQKNNPIPPFYSDGTVGEHLLNEMYPVPGVIASTNLSAVLSNLRRSNFYYAAPGDKVR